MSKKKAIKLAAASAVAASAFVAAAPAQTDAASNVAVEQSKAVTQIKKAYHTYSDVTATGKFADINEVYKQYNMAKDAYKSAKLLLQKSTVSNKDALLAELEDMYKEYIDKRVVTYIDAYNYATTLEDKHVALEEALTAGDWNAAEEQYHAISYELKTRTVILDRVYGQSTRELLRGSFKADAQAARDAITNEVSVKIYFDQAEALLAEGKLEEAKAKMDHVANLVAKLDSKTDFGAALLEKVEAAEKKYDELSVPKVESVSAINAKQLTITFKTAMDKASVTDVTKYAVKRAGAAAVALTNTNPAVTDADASLSADGKTLTITLDNALTTSHWGSVVEGDTFNFELGKLKAANGQEIAAQTVAVKYSDKVAPEFVSASASGKTFTNQVVLEFTEPVDTSVATATINGTVVGMSAGSTPNKVVLTSGSNLLVGTTYNVSLLNFKDAAGNLMSPNPVTSTVTVAGDTTAPTVTSVEVVRDSLLKVTFAKSMDTATVTNTSIKLLDANLGTTGITQGAVTAVPGTSNKSFYVPLTGVPFNSNGVFTGTVAIANTIKDAAGNVLAASSQAVSLTKDSVAPQVVSTTYKKVTTYGGQSNANGFIVIKFNEDVTASAANTTYTVVDTKTGAAISTPISARAINTSDSTELVLSLNAAVSAGSTTYTVVAPSDAVKDKSISTNSSGAANLTVDVSAGAPTAADTTAPVVASAVETAATSLTSGTSILVTFTEANLLDVATVTNASNYRLDGNALPAGSYVTYNSGAKTATVNIPAGTISSDKNYTLNVYNIKDAAGNTALPFIDTAITLQDDIKPEFTTATVNTNGTLSLGFSETMVTAAGKEAEFVVTLNGSALTGGTLAYSFANGLGSDAGKYVVTVATRAANVADGAGINGTNMNYLYVDVNGNTSYDSGTDILVASTVALTGTADDYTAGTFNLNNASTLTVATVASPTLTTDNSTLLNPVKGSKTITVK
jgi:rubrerythrin